MGEILYNSEIVELSYDKQKYLLSLIWKKSTNSDEFKSMFSKAIEFSEKNTIWYFLSDMRNEGLVTTTDMKWLEAEVLSRAIEKKIKKIALIFNDLIFSTVYAEVIKRKLMDSPIKVQFFSDVNSAEVWLLNDDN
jgi:hypothetical protein